jgi:hypothetical protein
MLVELSLYMPGEHPERKHPFEKPSYLHMISEDHPYRIVGDGGSVPPLVSSALGIHDIRGINVLIPDEYYQFFQNLISFSVPYTNNPDPLIAASSPASDLLGVKYVLSQEKLKPELLGQRLKQHLEGLRTIRFFNTMVRHSIRGGSEYGYFDVAGEKRFSLFFPGKFRFSSRIRITEPYLFIGLTAEDRSASSVLLRVDDRAYTLPVAPDGWTDRWIDLSGYKDRTIDIILEGATGGQDRIILGGFGLSEGEKGEENTLRGLHTRHEKELDNLKYMGQFEGMHFYENENVLPRAFVLHAAKNVDSLGDTLSELQKGFDFRRGALVTVKDRSMNIPEEPLPADEMIHRDLHTVETATIRNYSSNLVEIEVNTAGGLLVLSDLFYPGWKAKVNGVESAIVRTFGALRGVVVPGGSSQVVFSYRPSSISLGIFMSVVSLVGWISFLTVWRRRKTPPFPRT